MEQHEYMSDPDDSTPHLERPRCSCGWRMSGFVQAGIARSFHAQHLREAGLSEQKADA